MWLAMVAQLVAHPTSDQEFAGLTPLWSATFFHKNVDHEIFSIIILSLLLIKSNLSVSGKRMCTILVNHLED